MSIDLIVEDPSEALVSQSENVIKKALEGDHEDWIDLLSRNSDIDGLKLIFSHKDEELSSAVNDERGQPSLDWLIRLSRIPPSLFKGGAPQHDLMLFELWRSLQKRITSLLEKRARELPDVGYVLYFTESLAWCVVLSFKFSKNAAKVTVVHCMKEPKSVYDIFAPSNMNDEQIRTIVKKVARSQTKLIIHRNVLIKVDRYTENRVFGPTIDTLYLHEFLVRMLLQESDGFDVKKITTALEVGCGNGLLTAGLAIKCKNLKFLVAIDTEIQAVQCTTKNVDRIIVNKEEIAYYGILGEFHGDLLKSKFDLVLSNPPYLPYQNDDVKADESSQRVAIKGTELLSELVTSSPFYLSPGGALIMIYSELAEQELLADIPDSMTFRSANKSVGYKVLFDLEDVVEDSDWLKFLLHRGLEFDSESHVFHHYLKIGVVTHAEDKIITDGTVAGAILTLLGKP